jgi:hypothetical protein
MDYGGGLARLRRGPQDTATSLDPLLLDCGAGQDVRGIDLGNVDAFVQDSIGDQRRINASLKALQLRRPTRGSRRLDFSVFDDETRDKILMFLNHLPAWEIHQRVRDDPAGAPSRSSTRTHAIGWKVARAIARVRAQQGGMFTDLEQLVGVKLDAGTHPDRPGTPYDDNVLVGRMGVRIAHEARIIVYPNDKRLAGHARPQDAALRGPRNRKRPSLALCLLLSAD